MAKNLGNWQKTLDILLSKAIQSGCITDFACCRSDRARIEYILNHNLLSNVDWLMVYLDNCKLFHQKYSDKALHHKQAGNNYFKKKNYQEAIKSYTESVIHAPTDEGNDLSLAFGNRSAALYHFHRYKDCLKDINHAIGAGFPSESLYKLYLRRTQCYYHLNEIQLAKIELEKTRESILSQKAVLGEQKSEMVIMEVEELKCCFDDGKTSEYHIETTYDLDEASIPIVSHGGSNVITDASSAIEMRYNLEQGRFFVCNQDISAGDTLIVERPYSSVLLPDYYTTHCHHCYNQLPLTVVGCSKCTAVRYCSENCQRESWMSYHHIECSYLDILHSVGIAHLSLRIIIIAGIHLLKGFKREENDTNIIPNLSTESRYQRNYQAIYDLMPHTDDIQLKDLYQYSLTAALLLVILIHSDWFNQEHQISENCDIQRLINNKHGSTKLDGLKQNDEMPLLSQTDVICSNIFHALGTDGEKDGAVSCDQGLTSDMLDIGGLLLRHILQLVCNAHAITELQATDSHEASLVDTSQVRIAAAIYPTCSLMNHSCDPTIISSFHGDVLVVRAVKDVKAGAEIFNCYGPHYRRMLRSKRQEVLESQYFFKCSCTPCSEERKGDIQFDASICSQCNGCVDTIIEQPACTSCGLPESLKSRETRREINGLFQQGMSLVEKSDVKGALKNLQPCLKLCRKFLHGNNKLRASVEDSLARCFAILGDNKKAASHLEESIKVTELIYGSDSIEVAYELQKMADILFNAKQPEQALNSINRASHIFQVHFGESHETVKELHEMKQCLSDFIGAK